MNNFDWVSFLVRYAEAGIIMWIIAYAISIIYVFRTLGGIEGVNGWTEYMDDETDKETKEEKWKRHIGDLTRTIFWPYGVFSGFRNVEKDVQKYLQTKTQQKT